MRLATLAESKRIDEKAQSEYALSADALMEAAGSLSAREIEQSFLPELASRKGVAIFCGPGHNGADGLVVARHLLAAGHRVLVYLVGKKDSWSELSRLQLERCRRQGAKIIEAVGGFEEAAEAALFVDALFGIGLARAIETPFREAIELMNRKRAPVVSLDAPSGLDCDRGTVVGGERGSAVRASLTITFGLAKPGFFVSQGPAHVGRVRVLSIGFPPALKKAEARSTFAFTETQAHRALPRWSATSHKSDHGHALVLAGSAGMQGAGLLAASSAYRIGAGYVTLAGHDEPLEALKTLPEILTAQASSDKLWSKPAWTAAAIGPGLGAASPLAEKTEELLERLLSLPEKKVLVDADALTVLSKKKRSKLPAQWILTPHAGELSRILGATSEEIEANRFRFAREAARSFGCHVLLKGFRTVIAEPNGERATVVLAGNSALSKAGTGDVLTGMIVGLLAQGVAPFASAATGAYIHGRMADEWVRGGRSRRSLEASDLREILPGLIARLRPANRNAESS